MAYRNTFDFDFDDLMSADPYDLNFTGADIEVSAFSSLMFQGVLALAQPVPFAVSSIFNESPTLLRQYMEPQPLRIEGPGSDSALGDFSNSLAVLETGINDTHARVTAVREGAELVQSALKTFERIEFAADKVADTLDGIVKVLKVVGKVPALKFIAKKLQKIFKELSEEVRDIQKKAKEADDDLKEEKEVADKTVDKLMDLETLLDAAGMSVADVREAVDIADGAYNQFSRDFTEYDGDLEAVLGSAFGGALGNFDTLTGLLDTANLQVDFATGFFDRLTPFLDRARQIEDTISSIAGELDFLRGPLNTLSNAIEPIEDILDAIGFIYDTFVAPIVNPILEAIGVNALFDAIGDALKALFPDISILDGVVDGIKDLFGNLSLTDGLAFDIEFALTDFTTYLNESFLDLVLEVTPDVDEVIIPDGEDTGPINGGTGSDLITGNDMDNVINGGEGTDILTPGGGNDIVDGGAGIDAVVFDALFLEFSYERINDIRFDFIHEQAGGEGNDQISNVEVYIFRDLRLRDDQLDAVRRLTGDEDFIGGDEADIVFGVSAGGDNVIDGLGGNDYLAGGSGDDQLFGGDGDDLLAPGTGNDVVDGGAGFDTISYLDNGFRVLFVLLSSAEIDATPELFSPASGEAFGEAGVKVNITSIEQVWGTSFDDWLYGNFDNNIIEGFEGSDIIRGLTGDDILRGGDGQDFIFGGEGQDELSGDAGDDYVWSGAGDDMVSGGTGFDTVFYGGQVLPAPLNVTLDRIRFGESGDFDTLAFSIVYDGATNTVQEFDATGNRIGTDTLDAIERIYAPDGDNTLVGTSDIGQTLVGGAGDDVIRGNGAIEGIDRFFAGGGNDTIYLSGLGFEDGNGGGGTNQYIWDHRGEFTQDYSLTINSRGTDTIDFSSSEYAMETRDGIPVGETAIDTLYSFVGVNGFSTAISFDTRGIDNFIATGFSDNLDFTGEGIENIFMGAGNDRAIIRLSSAFEIRLEGGAGDDFLVVSNTGSSTQQGAILVGGAGNDRFFALPGHTGGTVIFEGGDGDDFFNAGFSTNEVIRGGDGIDTISVFDPDFRTDGTTVDLTSVRYDSIENAMGSGFDDVIIGTEGANELVGNEGDDIIRGGAGDDIIFGDRGIDQLFGGDGNDLIYGALAGAGPASEAGIELIDGGAGVDTASFLYTINSIPDPAYRYFAFEYLGLDWNVTANLDTGEASIFQNSVDYIPPGADRTRSTSNFELVDIENLIGTNLDDSLRGDAGSNTIAGLDGDDVLMGRAGDDALIGGFGNDVLMGGSGDDVLDAGEGRDSVYGGAGNDTIVLTSTLSTGGLISLRNGSGNTISGTDIFTWADTGTRETRFLTFTVVEGNSEITIELTPRDLIESTIETANSFYDYYLLSFEFLADYANVSLNANFDIITTLSEALAMDSEANGTNWGVEVTRSLTNVSTFVSGIENVIGTQSDDHIIGDDQDNRLEGNDGNDIIFGAFGSDTIYGGDGSDLLYGDLRRAEGVNDQQFSLGFADLNIGGGDQLADGSYDGATTDALIAENYSGLSTETGSFTIQMIYQASEQTRDQSNYLVSYATNDNVDELQIALFSTGAMQIVIDGESYNVGTSVAGYDTGWLYRLSVTYEVYEEDGASLGRLSVYQDGILVFTEDGRPAQTIDPNGRFVIGPRNNDVAGQDPGFRADRSLNGSVADIRVFDDARTIDEILADNNNFALIDSDTEGLVDNWIIDTDGIVNRSGTAELVLTGGTLRPPNMGGTDIAVFEGPRENYLITLDQSDMMTIIVTDLVGNGGTDRLFDIELIAFDDDSSITFVPEDILDTDLDRLENIDSAPNLTGTSRNDALVGSDTNEIISAFTGDDNLMGQGGDDLLIADIFAALSDIEGQVFRAYQAVFDRNPDANGYQNFLRAIRFDIISQEDMITEFVGSEEFRLTYGDLDNGAFIDQLYLNVFNREADTAGRDAFLGALDGGRSRASVVIEFANSPEFITLTALDGAAFATNVVFSPVEGQVFRLYQAVFDRAPDAGGFVSFKNALQAEVLVLSDIVEEFIASEEFQLTYGSLSNAEFIETLYANVLPGNMDPVGRMNFTAALDDGILTRAQVVEEFSESLEFRDATDADVFPFVRSINLLQSDTLRGGAGDDILFGGDGADTFIFDVDLDGNDTVLDFVAGPAGGDVIRFITFDEFDTFEEVMEAASQVGSDTVIDFENGQSLTLSNVQMDTLDVEDFLFDI